MFHTEPVTPTPLPGSAPDELPGSDDEVDARSGMSGAAGLLAALVIIAARRQRRSARG